MNNYQLSVINFQLSINCSVNQSLKTENRELKTEISGGNL